MATLPAIQTERLILRALVPDDAAALTAVFGDPEVMRYGPGQQDAHWIDAWIARRQEATDLFDGFFQWAIQRGDDRRVIGCCGLMHYADVNGRAEIELGYRLAKSHWGQGIATEAASAVRDYALEQLAHSRLVALIDPDNTASARVALKIGMRYEADALLDGYDHPDHVYVLERSTPPD